MVDFFLLLKLSGAGDELQGIKRGIIEMADAIIINKADGDNIGNSNKAKSEFAMAIQLYPIKKSKWTPRVMTCSSVNSTGIKPIWKLISEYVTVTKANNFFNKNRKNQNKYWLLQTINDKLQSNFFNNNKIKKELEKQYILLEQNKTTPFSAAEILLKI
jgi:LAO/AO transport system kinase